MKKLFVCLGLLVSCCVYGQDESENVTLSVDLANNYVWRGIATQKKPVVQPSITFFPERSFQFGMWASAPLMSKEKIYEVDIFVDFYITPFLNIGLTDYFVCEDGQPGYFNFKRDTTGHGVDLDLIFKMNDFPIRAIASTMIWGNDLNNSGKNNFSTYFEIGYWKSGKHVDWDIFLGVVPFKSPKYYDVEKFSIINVGFNLYKEFEIVKNYTLPASFTVFVNPEHKKVYLSLSLTIFNSELHKNLIRK